MAKSKSYGGLIALLILVLGAGGGTWYYFHSKADKQPEFTTTKVSRGSIVQTISATGNLQTTSQVTISSQVSGNVIDMNTDFNREVKKGQWLLKIDPATYEQKLRQAKADLDSAIASNTKIKGDFARTKELFDKNIAITKADYDAAVVQLAQSESTLVSRQAAFENAQTDLERCTIYSPIDGVVLNRTIDKGGTVNVNQSAVALFTLINALDKLQISADVSEADIGNVKEGQTVKFSVDAYLNTPFQGAVSQVRNFAKNTSGVVTFSVIIDVDNSNLLLKPGMTATANIIIAERPDVLVVSNNALRVRIPAEVLAKAPTAAKASGTAPKAATMTDDERRTAMRDVMTAAGYQAGSPVTPAITEKVTQLATEKGLDPAAILAQMSGGGRSGRGAGGGRGNRNAGTGASSGIGMNVSNAPRTVYKLVTDAAGKKYPEAVSIRLGISDGTMTQIVDGAAEGDSLITYVTMPGAAAAVSGPTPQSTSPFQTNQRGGGFGGGGRGGF